MTINYTKEVVDEKEIVKATITIPAKEEVKELGEKTKVVTDLQAEIAKCQTIIDTYTAKKAEVQAKLDAINAL